MGWVISLAMLVGCIFVKDINILIASGLFAIAGSIGVVATAMNNKNDKK